MIHLFIHLTFVMIQLCASTGLGILPRPEQSSDLVEQNIQHLPALQVMRISHCFFRQFQSHSGPDAGGVTIPLTSVYQVLNLASYMDYFIQCHPAL